ncbi:MAG: potassium channel family protein [Pseudomonadota bacterium]
MSWLLPHGQGRPGLLGRYRWGYLLAVLLATFLLEPLLGSGKGVSLMGLCLYLTVFAGMIRLAHLSRTVELVSYTIIGIWFVVSLVQHFNDSTLNERIQLAFSVALSLGALIVTFTELMRPDVLTVDKLFGAICGYFLIAVTLALLYYQIEVLTPGSFNLPPGEMDVSEFLYFSLVTVTTLGYGDITPVSKIARILAGLEAALGTLYIAILIGQIVGSIKR